MPDSAYHAALQQLPDPAPFADPPTGPEDYARLGEAFEAHIWQQGPDSQQLALYQRLFREQEAWIARQPGADPRFHITLVIPVADRPRQLERCLESLYRLCQLYHYGGQHNGRFTRVSAIIADDSRQPQSLDQHAALARRISARGLSVEHFDQDAQRALITSLPVQTLAELSPIIGDFDPQNPGHKGASPMRNIAYLALARLGDRDKRLFHFVDSDQEFQIRYNGPGGEREAYAINYLYQIDRLFRQQPIRALTGKVVGDPPVSPAVMAGNLLADILAYLEALSQHPRHSPCTFHNTAVVADDAAYHDMAGLFGFNQTRPPFDYPCPLSGDHSHSDCFAAFAQRLDRFFDGEHPTRKSLYQYAPARACQPARTIYTGNYVLRGDALEAFIPFAQLKLRMAGPTLGRILQATWGDAFVSANLPMLHRRTLEQIGEAEFRPGVDRSAASVDLSGEIERQFFGDLMLFTIIDLCKAGYPQQIPNSGRLAQLLDQTQQRLRDQYDQTQASLLHSLARLEARLADNRLWHNHPESATASAALLRFIANLKANFAKQALPQRLIRDPSHGQQRRQQIAQAITNYPDEMKRWGDLVPNPHFTAY